MARPGKDVETMRSFATLSLAAVLFASGGQAPAQNVLSFVDSDQEATQSASPLPQESAISVAAKRPAASAVEPKAEAPITPQELSAYTAAREVYAPVEPQQTAFDEEHELEPPMAPEVAPEPEPYTHTAMPSPGGPYQGHNSYLMNSPWATYCFEPHRDYCQSCVERTPTHFNRPLAQEQCVPCAKSQGCMERMLSDMLGFMFPAPKRSCSGGNCTSPTVAPAPVTPAEVGPKVEEPSEEPAPPRNVIPY